MSEKKRIKEQLPMTILSPQQVGMILSRAGYVRRTVHPTRRMVYRPDNDCGEQVKSYRYEVML